MKVSRRTGQIWTNPSCKRSRSFVESLKTPASGKVHPSSIRIRYLVHTSHLLFIFFRFFHQKKENCVYLHVESASAYDVK